MDIHSHLSNIEPVALEALYRQFLEDPTSVDDSWRHFFLGFDLARKEFGDEEALSTGGQNLAQKEFQVIELISAYRTRGHLFTQTNPVRERRIYTPDLSIEHFGLKPSDLGQVFQAGRQVGIGPATLQEIVNHLIETYCSSIGIEFMYIRAPERWAWIKDQIELKNRPKLTADEKRQVFRKLNQATVFEEFLQKRFVGQKRFSVEGGETLLPALDAIVELGTELGVQEFIIGMAHRGRLNTLAHILNKPYAEIFSEFAGKAYDHEAEFDGDVKYHMGHSTELVADSGLPVKITLVPNPSHLEAVDPVVHGVVRARIDADLKSEDAIVPILVHGDAAIAGQGIVYEIAQMAELDGYRVGGTVHIVVNNQIGFTTNYLDARSSTYCTDVAKVTRCPVFHVNADDADAVVQTVRIALAYRQRWHRDVYIDLLGYRKYGHNEGDEPKFTQPKLYKAIAAHPNAREVYLEKLIAEDLITMAEAEKMRSDLEQELDASMAEARTTEKLYVTNFLADIWGAYRHKQNGDDNALVDTTFDAERLDEIARRMTALPEGKFFRKVKKLMGDRVKMIDKDALDWGMGELLAYGTLLADGHPVRISGQDVERGTFSHRHAVLKTEDTEQEYIPLNHIEQGQAELSIFNSLLSEYGVLGFDFGYAYGMPGGLTIWEAQFGDFNNGAQIIIDQFICAGEDKWKAMNGLVMFLPHGYEGMGSEHSSGRMERFLQMCAQDNIEIANPTTPANHFHLLRRQVKRSFRKPLVVFTPKKLLRYSGAISSMKDLSNGAFQPVIDDASRATKAAAKKVKRVVLCSGKFYYDLLEERQARSEKGEKDAIAFVRIEQLYPFPEQQLADVLGRYPVAEIDWAQEEPDNMGAWTHMHRFGPEDMVCIARPASASPATGSPVTHKIRHQRVIDVVFSSD